MKLKVVDDFSEIIAKKKHMYSRVRFTIEEFIRMDANVVEIDPYAEGYSSPQSARSSFYVSIRNAGYKNSIKAITTNGKLYLIKIGEYCNDSNR